MIHFSLFGGQDAILGPGMHFYVNVFGGSTLIRPPLAARVIELRNDPSGVVSAGRYLFFSLFGSVTVKWPTLAEEYLSLLEALRTNCFRIEDWDRALVRHGDGGLRSSSIAIFGGFDANAVPTEDEELDALSLQRHAGGISDRAADQLLLAIGSVGTQRLAAVRQTAGMTLSGG
jgi:hypothetical protein